MYKSMAAQLLAIISKKSIISFDLLSWAGSIVHDGKSEKKVSWVQWIERAVTCCRVSAI